MEANMHGRIDSIDIVELKKMVWIIEMISFWRVKNISWGSFTNMV